MTLTPGIATGIALVLTALIFTPVLLRAMLRGGGLTLAGGGRQPAAEGTE